MGAFAVPWRRIRVPFGVFWRASWLMAVPVYVLALLTFAFCKLFADVPSVLSSQLVTKLCSVEYCAWHVAQNGSVSVCSGWNALAPWALPACRGPPEEVHSSVALYLPQSNHKASSPYIMKGLRSRPKAISVCSVHLQDLVYVVSNLMQRVLRTFV